MTNLDLRPAELEDAERLLQWRNDEQTRGASHNPETISLENHVRWLARTLENPNRRLFVAVMDGTPVGTVRADFDRGVWELSWTVAPEARGKRIGQRMVASLASELEEPIRAEVREGNIASMKIAEHAGMGLDREVDGVLHFFREALGRPT